MLNIIDLLGIKSIPLDNYKIHLATTSTDDPLDAYLRGQFKEWQERQNKKNFPCRQVLGLINLGNDRWLFAGVYEVLSVDKGVESPYLYRTRLLANQDDIIGRIIVKYKRPSRASYIWGDKYGTDLEIEEIRPTRLTVGEFPGYNNVIIARKTLKIVVEQQEPSWKSALMNAKGVYLICDTATGKMYVGSATGEGGLWQRFEGYAKSGHGGNADLKGLLDVKGKDYAENFQYSILEIADSHATVDFIVRREAYWKNVLRTREFGYNSN